MWGPGQGTKTDEFSVKFQTAIDTPPHFRKIMLQFFGTLFWYPDPCLTNTFQHRQALKCPTVQPPVRKTISYLLYKLMMNHKHHDIEFQFVSTQRLFPWHFMILNMHWLSQACPVCPSRELYIWGSSCYTRVTHTNIPTSARQHKIPKSGNFVNESCCW